MYPTPQRVKHSHFTSLHLWSADSCLATPVESSTDWREPGRSCSHRALTMHFWVSPPSFVYHGTAGWRKLLGLLHESHFHDKLLPVLHGILTLVLFSHCFELQKGEKSRAKSGSGVFSTQNVEGKVFHTLVILGNYCSCAGVCKIVSLSLFVNHKARRELYNYLD